MRIIEIVFQGIFGCVTPVRLDCSDPVTTCELPPGVSPRDVQDVFISMMFPNDAPQSVRVEYANGNPRIALKFDHRGKIHRIIRQADSSSIKVQLADRSGAFSDVAIGRESADYIREHFVVPDFEVVWALNCWRFEDSPSDASRFDIDGLDPSLKELVRKYRIAREAERADDKVQRVESRLIEVRRELGHGAALEEKLEMARKKLEQIDVAELKREDLELLRGKDRHLSEFDDQLSRLEHEEDITRQELYQAMPPRWFKLPVFWAGLAIGLVATIVAITQHDTGLRAVALANIVGFGMCVWVLINYFSGMERAAVHQVRLESIKRRLNQVREEQVSLKERLNHLLVHAKVDDARELDERVGKSEKLRAIIQKMEEQVAELSRDPEYVKAREEYEELEASLAVAEAERGELPESAMSAYQLQTDLQELGIDPDEVVGDSEVQEDEREPLERVLDAARLVGQYDGHELYSKTIKMWGRITGHVLGERFKEVSILNGGLVLSSLDAEQVEMWQRTRPSEYFALLAALCLALQVNSADRSKRGYLNSVLIREPAERLTSEQASKFKDVFGSAAKRNSITLLKTDV